MAKTLVIVKHAPGPMQNGGDGCCARWAEDGMCPGVKLAEWLNGLGDDDAPYTKRPDGTTRMTCGEVRDNWIRGNTHIVPADAELASALAQVRRANREQAAAAKRLAEVKALRRHAAVGARQ